MPTLKGSEAPLFRAFAKSEYAAAFQAGVLRLGSLAHYRKIEDDNRKDVTEGLGHFIDEGGQERHVQLGGDIYILSLSRPTVDQAFLRARMGEHLIAVTDPLALATDLEIGLKSIGFDTFGGMRGQPVQYSKGGTVEVPDDPMERAILSVTQKPPHFAQEDEYRMFAVLRRDPPNLDSGTLVIDLGRKLHYLEARSP